MWIYSSMYPACKCIRKGMTITPRTSGTSTTVVNFIIDSDQWQGCLYPSRPHIYTIPYTGMYSPTNFKEFDCLHCRYVNLEYLERL